MNSFEPNKLIKECIENKDLNKLRGTLTGIIVRDRNFSTGDFEKNIEYVVNKCGIDELFEQLDKNKPLIADVIGDKNLKDEDFSDAIYYLKNNFCEERIEDIKKVGRELYPQDKNKKNENESENEDLAKINEKAQKKYKFFVVGVLAILVLMIAAFMYLKK